LLITAEDIREGLNRFGLALEKFVATTRVVAVAA
jgi:hypothetical protein